MQTSVNVSRPPLDAAPACKNQSGDNGQSAGTASQRFTDRLVRLDSDRHRLQLDRYLDDLTGEPGGHTVRLGRGLTFAYTIISVLVCRNSIGPRSDTS